MERVHRMQVWKDVFGGRVLSKEAELAETYDMHTQPKAEDKRKRVVPIRKVAESRLVSSDAGPSELPDVEEEALPGEQPKALPQMGVMHPHVDVTSKEPPKVVQEKKAHHYALPSRRLYPLDNYLQVKTASRYFMETWKFIPPEDRHEYCQNLVKRASAMNLPTDPLIEKYGSATYAPEGDIEVCLDARRSNILDDDHRGLLDKLASVRFAMPPEDWAVALREFDKAASLDQHYGNIPDAYYTTFGKTAEKDPQKEPSETDPEEAIVIGNEYLTVRKLIEFVNNNDRDLRNRFGWEFTASLHEDPKGIFNSLPRDQKLVIMRMANVSDPTQGETAS